MNVINKKRLIIYATVFLIMGMSNSLIPVLPEISASANVVSGSLKYTLLFSGYFAGALLTMMPSGFLSDKYNKIRIIMLSIALTLFSGIILILADNIYMLISARLTEGIACGIFVPSAYSLLSEFEKKGRYIGEFNFLLNAGLAAGILVSSFLANRSVKGALIVFTLLAALLLFCLSPQSLAKNHEKKVRAGRVHILWEVKKALTKVSDKNYIRTWITAFMIFGVTGVMLAFYSDYSKDFLSKQELGIVITLLYASSMAGNIIAGRINMSFRTIISTGIILTAFGILLSISHPYTGFILIGIGSGTVMTGLPIAVSYIPLERGIAMGFFSTCTYAGLAFMPVIAGFFTSMGYREVFILTAVLMLLPFLIKDGIISPDE